MSARPASFVRGVNADETAINLHVFEVEGGQAGLQHLHDLATAHQTDVCEVFVVSCDFDRGGPWAGVHELLSQVLPHIEAQRPELIHAHAAELAAILPGRRGGSETSHLTLTDLASDEEKVRNYAADRALRNAHGLIDMLLEWRRTTHGLGRWVIACDAFGLAGAAGAYFFHELHRRSAEATALTLLLIADAGGGADVIKGFNSLFATKATHSATHTDETLAAPANAAQLAAGIEASIGTDVIKRQIHLPDLLRFWQAAGNRTKVIRLRLFGMSLYLHEGLYADALRYGEGLLEEALTYESDNERLQRDIAIKLLNGLMGVNDANQALLLIHERIDPLLERASDEWKIDIYYLTAMIYARFLQPRNFVKGEEYLDKSLALIECAVLSEERRHFLHVFNRNGLAMIRSFQRRAVEAIDLCSSGLDRLNAYVASDKHRLHRSVLVYNIGKVYAAIGKSEEAIRFYSEAIEMDTHYSEYYNERGCLHLAGNNLDSAREDYLRAIALSPPYYEVFTNLGQCYRGMCEHLLAIGAYTRSLDIEPEQVLALLGRAQAHEQLGQPEAAICDYTSALCLNPDQWEALASRGSLYYSQGELDRALQDLNAAVQLSPEQSDLYHNRSIVLSDLLARDVRTVVSRHVSEDERIELLERLTGICRIVAQERYTNT